MTSPARAARKAENALDPELRRLGMVVILGAIMSILDVTIVIVAIDTLSRDFHTSLSTIQWVSTGYLLALSAVIPLSGWTVERFGAKRMWMWSLVMFTLGSAMCGLAWNAPSLIVFRVLQGLGGGMIMPIGMSILAKAAGPARIGRVMGTLGVPMLLGPVLGPVLGGLLVTHLSWRWCFYVNVPMGIVALYRSKLVLPADDVRGDEKLDLRGLALLSPGLALAVYGLSEAGSGSGFGSTTVLVSIIVGVLLVAGFVVNALRVPAPLLDMRLFGIGGFRMASLTAFTVGAGMFGTMFVLPLYYQVSRGQSALAAGLLMAPQGLGAMLTMPVGGRLTDRIGPRNVVTTGITITVLGTIAYTQVGAHTNEVVLALCLVVRGLGLGLTMMPSISAAYQVLPPAAIPRATTALNIIQRVGGALSTAIIAVEIQRSITHHIGNGTTLGTIHGKPTGALSDHLASAFGTGFWWALVITALGILPAVLLPNRPPPAAPPPVGEQAGAPEAEQLLAIAEA